MYYGRRKAERGFIVVKFFLRFFWNFLVFSIVYVEVLKVRGRLRFG